MATIYELKPGFQRLLQPVTDRLFRRGVTPNQVTLLAMALSFCGGVALVLWSGKSQILPLVPVLLLVRMALNAIDGMLARQKNLSTPLGEILNEVGDVLSDMFLYAPLVFWVEPMPASFAMLFLFIFLGAMSEFCGVLARAMIDERRYDGPMGKSDRAFIVGLYALALFFWPGLMEYSDAVFGMATLLLILCCRNRLNAILVVANERRKT